MNLPADFDTTQLFALAAALGWASGVRLYAAVFLTGLAGHLGWLPLPSGLHVLQQPPLLFVSALVQYNTSTHIVSTNARMRWEYRPGSELFVVYSDGRTTTGPGFPELQNRSVVVKMTKLFRW